jgi:transcriptional regulator with XRE-family HTH domain
MGTNAKEQFAQRLIAAMLDVGHKSQRNAKSGVDVGPLAKVAKVTREMARRYTEGTATPDVNRMKLIADWLGVRLAWLRDGEGPQFAEGNTARQPGATYANGLSEEAREVALAWQKLAPDTRTTMRDVIFMLSLGERRFPWLRRGRPTGETYIEWERRQEQNFAAMSRLQADRKERMK